MLSAILTTLLLTQATAEATDNKTASTESSANELREQDFTRAANIVVERTNAYRRGRDLSPLSTADRLNEAAQSFAEYMARSGNYGHEADGRTPAERIAAAGYEYCRVGENIGWQQKGDERIASTSIGRSFFTGWRDSPPHHENIVEPSFTEIGTGFAVAETGRYYAVQLFGRPQSLRFAVEVVNQSGQNVSYTLGGTKYELTPRMWRQHELCETTSLTLAELEPRDIGEAIRLIVELSGETLTLREEGEPRELVSDE